MKKLAFAFCLVATITAQAQVPQAVVAELHTNTRCGICGSRDPNIVSVLQSSPQVLQISYYPSSPYSDCFFSLQNPTENDNRTKFYNVYGSTPQLFIQGVPQSVSSISTNTLAGFLNKTTAFEIRLAHQSIAGDSATVRCVVTKKGADTSTVASLFLAAQEDSIDYAAPNGIPRHFGVFRKSLNTASGENVVLPAGINDSIVILKTYAIKAAWNKNLLSAFAILQRNASKQVINGSKQKLALLGTTGLNEISTPEVSLFPNPATDFIQISSAGNYTKATIFNTLGDIVQQGSVSDNRINTTALPIGIYFLRLSRSKDSVIRTFQKTP